MLSGPPVGSFPKNDLSTIPGDPSTIPGHQLQASAPNMVHWQSDKQGMIPNLSDQEQVPQGMAPSIPNPQFHSNPGYPSSIPIQSSIKQIPPPLAPDKLPPYPLFPPGLITGMVRKMQIGSRVPYSPMSTLFSHSITPSAPSIASPRHFV